MTAQAGLMTGRPPGVGERRKNGSGADAVGIAGAGAGVGRQAVVVGKQGSWVPSASCTVK